MTYQGVVYISNEIRFVLATARQVNLAAQNASLAARHAGDVRGFQAVSAELKSFSQGLESAMNKMSVDILAIAQYVSVGYRHRRLARHYETAEAQANNRSALEGAYERLDGRRREMQQVAGEGIQRLARQLVRSIQWCDNGLALARSAMIEASGGGEYEGMLRKVADDIERTIEDIHSRLKLIAARLHTEQEDV